MHRKEREGGRWRALLITWTIPALACTCLWILGGAAWAREGQAVASAADGGSAGFAAYFEKTRWSPYVVGIALGVLSWLTFLLSDKPLGVSSAFARTSGMIEKGFRGAEVERKAYYREYVPKVDWGWMLVLGILLGAFLSAALARDFRVAWVPTLWESRFGPSPLLRWVMALVGGIVMGVGARWAGGCTSGHALSGTLQLAVSSWVAALCFFAGGIGTALLLHG